MINSGAGVAVGEGVGLGADVAGGEAVGFASPPHATKTNRNRAAIGTINVDDRMTKRAPPYLSASSLLALVAARCKATRDHSTGRTCKVLLFQDVMGKQAVSSFSHILVFKYYDPPTTRWTAVSCLSLAGITHIILTGPKHLTILDESHRSITHECRQLSHQTHKTICRPRELVFDGQRRSAIEVIVFRPRELAPVA